MYGCVSTDLLLVYYKIEYDKILPSTNEMLTRIDISFYVAYDLYKDNEIVCTLILDSNNGDFLAALDSQNNLITGLVDSSMLKEEWFEIQKLRREKEDVIA